MTKKDVINQLDRLEPELDHSELSGQSLIEARRRYHIGVFKNKQQLIKAIEKATKEEATEKVKREALKLLKE
jgi:hypothetical protein